MFPHRVPIVSHNPHLKRGDPDHLYHLGLNTVEHDLPEMFSNIKVVCMGGSADRALVLAKRMAPGLADPVCVGKTERFSLYRVGSSILSGNHGMGMDSLSIFLNEIFKLLWHAGATDVIFIRVGTSGGIGHLAGTVCLGTEGVDHQFRSVFRQETMGEVIEYPAQLNVELREMAFALCGIIPVVVGKTMGTHDFYEGQGRLDGACCEYDVKKKVAYLERARNALVANIEMEATLFAAFCNRVKIPGLLCNVILLDRLGENGDQISRDPKVLAVINENGQEIATRTALEWLRRCSVLVPL